MNSQVFLSTCFNFYYGQWHTKPGLTKALWGSHQDKAPCRAATPLEAPACSRAGSPLPRARPRGLPPFTWEGVPEAPSRALVTMLPCTGTAVSTRFLSTTGLCMNQPTCPAGRDTRGGALRQLRHFASLAGAHSVLATCTLNAETDTTLQEVPSTRDSPDNA